ncbi:MAG: hypothetical protein HYY23_07810 [Verrucomicrobia bacterium]|nr:hypothetical protein [Verrucomicrobiota bacterium]
MRLTKIVAACALIVSLAGCMTEKRKRAEFFAAQETVRKPPKDQKSQPPPPFTREEAEDAICETVIARFARDASARSKTDAEVVFVGLTPTNLDPNPGFLRKFERRKPAVLPISAAARSDDNHWIEKTSGKRGVVLRIERIDWDGFYTVRVPYVWSAGSSSHEHAESFQLSWKRGRWVVL